mgnify:CR=1 FL=1
MSQVDRNLTGAGEGLLAGKWSLIQNQILLFTAEFLGTLESARVKPVRQPPKSPNPGAPSEQFVRNIWEACLNWMSSFGEASLRKTVQEFVEHHCAERNHWGLASRIFCPETGHQGASGVIQQRQ